MRTRELDMSDTIDDTMIEDFLVDAAWAIRSTYHTVLKSTPGAAIFGRDMLFGIPYVADWNKNGRRRQEQVESTNKRETGFGFVWITRVLNTLNRPARVTPPKTKKN